MSFIVDRKMPDNMIEKLKAFGDVYKSAKIYTEDESVSTHPDMQIHFISADTAVCHPDTAEYYAEILPSDIKILKGRTKAEGTYPAICAYNIARVDKFVICNTKYAEKSIIDFYNENGYKIIHVNQGYAKCNICPLTSDVFITEDVGIFNTTKEIEGITPILIEHGSVKLKGFDYGFVGGASGLFKNKLLLCGSLKGNSNQNKIKNALKTYGCEYAELSDKALCDFGSIIFFE